MRTIMCLLIILFLPLLSGGNTDCVWTSQKKGIIIKYVAQCDASFRRVVDSVLHHIIFKIARKDTSLKILVLVNHEKVCFPNSGNTNFFSIGFDTLRTINDDYIQKYYSNLEQRSVNENGGLNKFESKSAPLNINSTKTKDRIADLGIKIIYNIDRHYGEPNWNYIEKAVEFSILNPLFIQRTQHTDTVRYCFNQWYVSLVTIDSIAINKIIGRKSIRKQAQSKEEESSWHVWFLISLIVIAISATFYKRCSK